MIRRWVRRFIAWAFAEHFGELARRIEILDVRLVSLQNAASIHTAVPGPAMPYRWGCGHDHISGVITDDNSSKCLDCHQEPYR